jgi:hypothetical protein
MAPETPFGHKINGADVNDVQKLIRYPCTWRKEKQYHAAHNHCGYKIGGVGNTLTDFSVSSMPKGIEEQSQDDRYRKSRDQAVKVQNKSIENDHRRVGGIKKPNELIQSHPGTAPNTKVHTIISKGDLHTVQRPVMEYQRNENTREEKPVDVFIFQNPF